VLAASQLANLATRGAEPTLRPIPRDPIVADAVALREDDPLRASDGKVTASRRASFAASG
jgi:hypothetical protein